MSGHLQVYLGIDLGASSGRVMAGLWDGRSMRLEEIHRFANGGIEVAGTLRWDILRLWQEIQHGLQMAARRHGRSVVSIGVDTWALDYVLLSKSDEVLGMPFCYRDARTRGKVAELMRRVPRAEVFAASGLQFMEINTLCQWMAHHQASPEVFATASTFLMIPDWLNWCLCGAKVSEFSNATTTQFLNPLSRQWSTSLLQRLDLPTHILPELVQPGTCLGQLRSCVASQAGFERVPVCAPATHDTGCAVVGVPTIHTGRTNWAFISSGTWSLIGVESKGPQLGPKALDLNFTNEGGVDGTWRVLKNVMGLWLLQRCAAAFENKGGTGDHSRLVALAAGASALRSLIDPDDSRFLNPSDMPAAIQEFCLETNQPAPDTEAQIVRCVLESLALKYAVVLAQLEDLLGQNIEVIHVVGGGARNSLLNQLTADACGRPVVAGPVEATVMGNLLIQARTMGEVGQLSSLREILRSSSELQTFTPRVDHREYINTAAGRFSKLLRNNSASSLST